MLSYRFWLEAFVCLFGFFLLLCLFMFDFLCFPCQFFKLFPFMSIPKDHPTLSIHFSTLQHLLRHCICIMYKNIGFDERQSNFQRFKKSKFQDYHVEIFFIKKKYNILERNDHLNVWERNIADYKIKLLRLCSGAVVAVIVWWLDLQLYINLTINNM